MQKSEIEKEIQINYPNFEVKKLERIGEGMDSVAFLVNDFYIFRFPKNEEVRRNLAKEIAALPLLRPHLKIKIPDFEFIGAKTSFVGYEKIAGVELTKKKIDSFSENEQISIQKTLAEFLLTIHRQNTDEFTKCGVEVEDFRAEYTSTFGQARKSVFPLLSVDVIKFIENQFIEYLENDENFSGKPVLLHNDLSFDHIFVEPETKQINGIIDFGDIAIGDGDYDLMYLLDDYGEYFVRSFLQFYPCKNHEKLFRKLYFWGLADILQMMLHYLEEQELDEIEPLKKYLIEWILLMKLRKFTQKSR